MTIANVSLTNTFDEWRIKTNQLINIVNDVEGGNLFRVTSNTSAITVSANVTRGGILYISANVSVSDADTSTANIASANLANIINQRAVNAFDKANSANYFAYLVNANTVAAFDKANSANYFAYLVNANTVAAFNKANSVETIAIAAFDKANTTTIGSLAFDKANSANYFAYLVDANATAAFARANAANSLATNAAVGTINFVASGAGEVIPTGTLGDLIIPFNAYISEWALLSDTTANATVDIYKTTYANYGTDGAPNSTNTITGTEQLTLSSATKNTSTALTGWTTTINTNDVLRFNVTSISAATKLTVALKVIKT